MAYGQPEIRVIEIEGDEYLFRTRFHRTRDRRGEVVLAIERPGRCVLLHTKGWYEPGVYRLGVLDCCIHYVSQKLSFVSYVFHLPQTEGVLRLPHTAEDISDFRDVPIADLPSVAEHLRHVPPPRTGWGRWRAVAHDFVHEMLEP